MLTNEEYAWLKSKQRLLEWYPDTRTVSGVITFRASYDKTRRGNEFQILYNKVEKGSGQVLHSRYKIKIVFDSTRIPRLFVVGLISYTADRHFDQHEAACLCGLFEGALFFSNGYSFISYIEKLVMPFLYGQTYLDIFGIEKWPWEEYSHSVPGFLESYSTSGNIELLSLMLGDMIRSPAYNKIFHILTSNRKPRKDSPCFCNQHNKLEYTIEKCNPKSWEGLCKLYTDFKLLPIDRLVSCVDRRG